MKTIETIESERRAAIEGALFKLRPDMGALIVTGRDRQSWLNGLVTCELAGRKPGEGVYGLTVGKTGRIAGEVWVIFAEDHLVVAVPADRLEGLREHFDRHLIMEDAEVTPAPERGFLAVHGPLAGELVSAARALGADAALVDFSGRSGETAVVLAPSGQTEAVRDALLSRAGERGAEATAEGWEHLRIAWGVPRFGVDFDDQSLPQEASLERLAVSFSKGCYLGQETVFMLEKRGHAKKRLMRLSIEGGDAPDVGAEIALPDGAKVGEVTSSTKALDGSHALALGHVKWKHAVADAAVTVAGRPARLLGLAAERGVDPR
jgi:tRNA-modifying protein YgfZ